MAAHPSHKFVPEWDGDNMECAHCMCRPYGDDARKPCPEDPGHGGQDWTTRTVEGAEAKANMAGWAESVRTGKEAW